VPKDFVSLQGFTPYNSAVQRAYSEQPVEQPPEGDGKRAKRYEVAYRQVHDIGFNKRRVADALKPILVEGGAEAQGLGDLRAVANRIWDVLQGQVKPETEAARVEHA
jgi:hypothetical protein